MRNRALELSKQEVKILRWAWEGKSVKETAEKMGISATTVKNYRSNIYDKFQVGCVELMLRQGVEHGYLHINAKPELCLAFEWPG